MSRADVIERVVVTGMLVSDSALHVGAAGSDGIEADLDVARNGSLVPIIPGTSLAGLLRAHAHAIAAADRDPELLAAWRALFGSGSDDLHAPDRSADAPASLLSVHDAVLIDSPRLERRDHVGIDRATAAAAERIKYDRLVIASESCFAMRLVLLTRAGATDAEITARERLLFALCDQLRDGVSVGGAGTRGLGRCHVEHLRIVREPLTDRADAIAALRRRLTGAEPDLEVERPDGVPELAATRCAITIGWKPDRAVLIRQGVEGDMVDNLPLTTSLAGERRTLLLPGASIKGGLRAAAERMVRTAAGLAPPNPCTGTTRGFSDQLQVPLVTDLFGTLAAAAGDGEAIAAAGRGALEVPDVHAVHDVSERDWQAAITGDDRTVTHHELRSASGGRLADAAVMTHVALDRWTQGASEGKLFDVLEPLNTEWRPIVLCVDLSGLRRADEHGTRQLRLAVGALLWLVVQELRAGDLPLGGLVTRGHGAVAVTGVHVTDGQLLGLTEAGELAQRAESSQAWQKLIGAAT